MILQQFSELGQALSIIMGEDTRAPRDSSLAKVYGC